MKRISKAKQHADTILLCITIQQLAEKNIKIRYDVSELEEASFKSSTAGLPVEERFYITISADSLCNKIMSYIPNGKGATVVVKRYTKAHVEMQPYYLQLQTSGKCVDFVSALHYQGSDDYSAQNMIKDLFELYPKHAAEFTDMNKTLDEKLLCLLSHLSYEDWNNYVMDKLFVSRDTVFYESDKENIYYYSFERDWMRLWMKEWNYRQIVPESLNKNEKTIKHIIGTDITITSHGTEMDADIHIKRPGRLSKYYDMYMRFIRSNSTMEYVDGAILYKYRPSKDDSAF